MPDEHPLTLRQADQARGDFASIAEDLDFIKLQLARLPTRKELATTAVRHDRHREHSSYCGEREQVYTFDSPYGDL